MLQKLKDIGFTQVSLRDVTKPPHSASTRWTRSKRSSNWQQQDTAQADRKRWRSISQTLRQLYDLLSSRRERLQAVKHLTESEQTFFLQGWVPAPMMKVVEETLKKVSPTVALEFSDPREGEEPPVLTA